jgi:hypothetical protein
VQRKVDKYNRSALHKIRVAHMKRQRDIAAMKALAKINSDPNFWRAVAIAGSGQALILMGLRAVNPDPNFWRAVAKMGAKRMQQIDKHAQKANNAAAEFRTAAASGDLGAVLGLLQPKSCSGITPRCWADEGLGATSNWLDDHKYTLAVAVEVGAMVAGVCAVSLGWGCPAAVGAGVTVVGTIADAEQQQNDAGNIDWGDAFAHGACVGAASGAGAATGSAPAVGAAIAVGQELCP